MDIERLLSLTNDFVQENQNPEDPDRMREMPYTEQFLTETIQLSEDPRATGDIVLQETQEALRGSPSQTAERIIAKIQRLIETAVSTPYRERFHPRKILG